MTMASEATALLLRCGLFSSLIKTLVDEVGVGVKDIPANLPGQKTWINCAQYNEIVIEVKL
jgi:hypothetical protein